MDVHPTKNGIFIGIDPYPYVYHHLYIIFTLENHGDYGKSMKIPSQK